MKILYSLLFVSVCFNTTLHCQSLIKSIHGDLYINEYDNNNLISNLTLKNNLNNFELKNDEKYLFSTNNDFAVIKLKINDSDTPILIKANEYPDGFVINDLKLDIVKNQKDETNWIWAQFVEILNDPFENKNSNNYLFTTSGMGISRDLFNQYSTQVDVIPNAFISIGYSEYKYVIKEDCEISKSTNIIKNNNEILIDFECDSIILDNQQGQNILLVQKPISEDINIAYNMLSDNINEQEKIISELILVDLLIKKNYTFNAKYLIKKFNNKLISDYFEFGDK